MTNPVPNPGAPKASKLGPGVLTIGETGQTIDFSCQVTETKVTWEVDDDDNVPVLCGGTMAGDRVYSASLEATIIQDYSEGGLIDFTWKNKGQEVPFNFVPVVGASITGNLIVDPIDIGGEVSKKNTADIEWPIIGEPVFKAAPDAGVNGAGLAELGG